MFKLTSARNIVNEVELLNLSMHCSTILPFNVDLFLRLLSIIFENFENFIETLSSVSLQISLRIVTKLNGNWAFVTTEPCTLMLTVWEVLNLSSPCVTWKHMTMLVLPSLTQSSKYLSVCLISKPIMRVRNISLSKKTWGEI